MRSTLSRPLLGDSVAPYLKYGLEDHRQAAVTAVVKMLCTTCVEHCSHVVTMCGQSGLLVTPAAKGDHRHSCELAARNQAWRAQGSWPFSTPPTRHRCHCLRSFIGAVQYSEPLWTAAATSASCWKMQHGKPAACVSDMIPSRAFGCLCALGRLS